MEVATVAAVSTDTRYNEVDEYDISRIWTKRFGLKTWDVFKDKTELTRRLGCIYWGVVYFNKLFFKSPV